MTNRNWNKARQRNRMGSDWNDVACIIAFGVFSLILDEDTMSSRPSFKGISSRLYREKPLLRSDHAPSYALINDPSFTHRPLGQEGQSLRDSADLDGDISVPHIHRTVERIHHFLQFLIVWLLQAKGPTPLPAANAEKFRGRFLELQERGRGHDACQASLDTHALANAEATPSSA